jgi:hypothetical protein
MYIVDPTDEYLKIFPYAPILILFGDRHNDDKGYCDPVTNKIFDTEFLQLISDAVAGNSEKKEQDGIVDFYLEGGDIYIHTYIYPYLHTYIHTYIHTYLFCFFKKLFVFLKN